MNKDEAIKEIKQLKELLDSGILTQDEYDVKSADLKKIILDSEKKKDEPSESKKEKEYWEQKAKEKPKTESTLKPTKAKQEKETVKPKVDAARNYIEKEKEIKISFKQFVIISSIVCFILCLIIPQNFVEYNWDFPDAFGYFIGVNIGTIIYLKILGVILPIIMTLFLISNQQKQLNLKHQNIIYPTTSSKAVEERTLISITLISINLQIVIIGMK
jgi:hypothetical protein